MQEVLKKVDLPALTFAGVELISVVIALTVAVVGLRLAFKEKWLLARHQAEQCRLLKYNVLIHPALWPQLEWIDARLLALQQPDVRHGRQTDIKEALKKATREPVPYGPFEMADHLVA